MIVFAHTKFSLVRIQESGVKRGGGIRPPPQSERVFQIPVQIGLSGPIMNEMSYCVFFFVCLHIKQSALSLIVSQ